MKWHYWYLYTIVILGEAHMVFNLMAELRTLDINIDKYWKSSNSDCFSRNGVLSICRTCTLPSPTYFISPARHIFMNFKISAKRQKKVRTIILTINTKKEQNSKDIQSIQRLLIENDSNELFRDTLVHTDFNVIEGNKYATFFLSVENQNCSNLAITKVSYYYLSKKSYKLAKFESSAAPDKQTDTITINGKCTDNSVIRNEMTRPVIYFYHNGTYSFAGKCECGEGYEINGTLCKACSIGNFKLNIGNNLCEKCGANTLPSLANTCPCISGYFRIKEFRASYRSACYSPPSKPINISVSNTSATSVNISWFVARVGSNPTGTYAITCMNCPSQSSFPIYHNGKNNLIITDLESYATYRLHIVKENNITNLTDIRFSSSFEFLTREGAPGVIQNVSVTTLMDGDVLFSWQAPFGKGSPHIKYLIEHGKEKKETSSNYYKIIPTENSVVYTLKITAVALNDGIETLSEYSHVEKVRVKGVVVIKQTEENGPSKTLLAGVIAGVALFVVILLTIIIVLCKRQKKPNHMNIYRMEDGSVELRKGEIFDKDRIYIDPTTYSELDYAVYDFALELNSKHLEAGPMLGSGEFAEVYRGILYKEGKPWDVAIKKLKYNASKRDRDDFISEAAILGQFNDPNVVHLEGVILKEVPNVIVLELMGNGSLDTFLQKNNSKFSVAKLLGMTRGVASGMKYLSELGYIHRDLAARNVLVDKQEICKIADFGMSRELKMDEIYSTRGGKIPIKWTAPEAIQFKKFTTGSDVWSYGIVLWEIMSYGERPYWDWPNFEVLERLATGYRLPPPVGCPKVVHDLMLDCWNKDRLKRPQFSEILEQVEEWIKDSALLLDENKSMITKLDDDVDYSIVMGPLVTWLAAIKMEQYNDLFLRHDFTTPKHILHFSLTELEEIGIVPIGHQKKIFKAIKNSRLQIEGRKRAISRNSSSIGYAKSAISKKISIIASSLQNSNNHSSILENGSTLETITGT